jgi:hypothetical protein
VCGAPVAADAAYCNRCGAARGQIVQPKPARNGVQKVVVAIIGLFVVGLAALVLLSYVLPSPDRTETTDQEVAAIYLRQAEACQVSGDKNCVKLCAEKMYRLLSAKSQRDRVDRRVALEAWHEVIMTGDLGYRPPE